MNANMSVTNREVPVDPADLLVTKTNLKGQLSYCNDKFLKILGYVDQEVVGVGEESLRHPDIPPAIYNHLWETVKQGFPWKGLLKYRCKNGDHLWLQSNITPIYKNFKVDEVLFVCYPANRHQISDVEELYRGVITGKKSLRPKRKFMDRLGFFSKLPFAKQMSVTMSISMLGWVALALVFAMQANYIVAGLVVASMAFIGFVGFSLSRHLKTVLDQITNALYRLTDGEFRNDLDISTPGDLGDLLRAMQGMQVKLNYDLDEIQTVAVATNRLKQALDNASTNVMVADTERNIIYLNDGVKEMFSNAQDDIRKDLPDFDTHSLFGANIDLFFAESEAQRKKLEKLEGTVETSLVIGGRHFLITANPVTGDQGERLGSVVEWLDRTEQVHIQDEIAGIVEAVQKGNLGSRLDVAGKQGFFADLSNGINLLADSVESVFSDIDHVISSMSSGDLEDKITNDYDGTYASIKEGINSMQDKLGSIFGQVRDTADFINNSSQEIATGNNNLSQRADEQASSLEQTASSMDQLTSTVKNNADNAQQANDVANTARELAENGGNVVNRAVTAMDEINTSSAKIAEIISVIDEIAFQTNLLALNASVEAARAGDQGRGFSVVATEVRNLAQRSATAAKESKELIQSSVEKVRVGAELVHDSGEMLTEIVSSVKKVGDFVAEIAAASQQQSEGIVQVNQAVTQMDRITQQNAALAEEASAASISMSEQSGNMVNLLGFFKIKQGKNSAVSASPEARQQPSKPAPRANPPAIPVSTSSAAEAIDDQEWEEF